VAQAHSLKRRLLIHTRHSGAAQGAEPGIHNPCEQGATAMPILRFRRIWIPDLSLRANPE
jgi:hypothetical protein